MQKNKYIYHYIENVLSNKYFMVFIILCLLVFSYFISTLDKQMGYFDLLSFGLTFQQFITLCFLPMIILFNSLMQRLYDSNDMLIVRLENKKEYIKEQMKCIFIFDSFIYICLLLIIFAFLNVFSSNNFDIYIIDSLQTNNFIYSIFIMIKLYALMILFSMYYVLITKLVNKTFSLITGILFSISIYLCTSNSYIVANLLNMPLYLGYYFIDVVQFSSFKLCVLSFITEVLLNIIVLTIIYVIYNSTKKEVGI